MVQWSPQNPPSTTVNPQDESVPAGLPDPLTVSVQGAPPLYFQWQLNGTNLVDDTRIDGSTNATLSINAVQFSDAGSYQVVITNAFGSVTSTPAVLTVTSNGIAPQITNQPVSQSVLVGANAAFSVSATGSAPIAYQWLFNGTNVSGATTASLVIASVSLSSAGSYSVIVSNAYGTATNLAGTLSVASVPLVFATNGTGIQIANGMVVLQVSGLTTSGTAEVEVSSDLIQWIPIFTNSTDLGTIQVIDTNAANVPQSYYRVVVSP